MLYAAKLKGHKCCLWFVQHPDYFQIYYIFTRKAEYKNKNIFSDFETYFFFM